MKTSDKFNLIGLGIYIAAGAWQTLQHANCARGGAPWSTSPAALGDGRYRWHHDQVLKQPWVDRIEEANKHKRAKYRSAGAMAGEPTVSQLKLDAGALLISSFQCWPSVCRFLFQLYLNTD